MGDRSQFSASAWFCDQVAARRVSLGIDHGTEPPTTIPCEVTTTPTEAQLRRIIREELEAHELQQRMAPRPGELERLAGEFRRRAGYDGGGGTP